MKPMSSAARLGWGWALGLAMVLGLGMAARAGEAEAELGMPSPTPAPVPGTETAVAPVQTPPPIFKPGDTPSILLFLPERDPAAEPAAADQAAEPVPVHAAGDTPSLLIFLPKEEKQVDEGPAVPTAVDPDAMGRDPAALLPSGALAYAEASSTRLLAADWRASPIGKVMADERMERFLSINPIGLGDLFRDLPDAIAPQNKVNLLDAAFAAARKLPPADDGAGAVGVYRSDSGDLAFVYLLDIGSDRMKAWDLLQAFGDALTADFRAIERETVRAGDFRDRFSFPGHAGTRLETGFVGNFAYFTTLSGWPRPADAGGNRLVGDPSLRQIRQSLDRAKTRPGFKPIPLVGFVRLGGLAATSADVPAGQAAARNLGFLFGGAGDPDASIRYVLRDLGPGGAHEQWLCPARGGDGDFPSWLKANGRAPANGWETPLYLPLNPNPVFSLAAQVDPARTAEFFLSAGIVENVILGRADIAASAALAARAAGDNATGQVAFGFANENDGQIPWSAVIAVKDAANAIGALQQFPKTGETAGLSLHALVDDAAGGRRPGSAAPAERAQAIWTVVGGIQGRLPAKPLLIGASNLDLLQRWIDQLSAGRVVDASQSALVRLAAGEAGKVSLALAAFDTPQFAAASYSEFGSRLQRYYPRLSNLTAKPPLSLFRGLGPVTWSARPSGDNLLLSTSGPFPTAPVLAMANIVAAPSWIRERGRRDLAFAGSQLKQLWLRLQLYQTRNGHFPVSLAEFAANLPAEERGLLTSPAAAGRLGEERAGRESYTYVAGLSTSDDPGTPLLYDSQPWHNEYANVFNPSDPSPTGPYRQYRLVLNLDGRVVPVDEETFQRDVLPRTKPTE